MRYNEAVDYIFSFSSLEAMPSLKRIKFILSELGQPQNSFKSVHIAGTNGKGSVATYISSVLTESGYKTGLFTSPHIVSFCERIQVDGEMISKGDVARITEKLVPTVESMSEKPTAFDLITAVAFEYFSEKRCDFAVLECGLGGKFDSTNAVMPELSVLCSISLDHIGVLGDNIEDITCEKCGIIKNGVPVVTYPFEKTDDIFNPLCAESRKIITDCAKRQGAKLVISDSYRITGFKFDLDGSHLKIEGLELFSPLSGAHQAANMLTAYTAICELSKKYPISDSEIISGFSKSNMPARFEKINTDPTVIIDGGHNADCARALRLFVKSTLKDEKITAVIAMMKDKQYGEVISKTADLFDNMIVTEISSKRACNAEELADEVKKYNKKVTVERDICTAIKKAVNVGNTVVIYGSFYLAGRAKEFFSR